IALQPLPRLDLHDFHRPGEAAGVVTAQLLARPAARTPHRDHNDPHRPDPDAGAVRRAPPFASSRPGRSEEHTSELQSLLRYRSPVFSSKYTIKPLNSYL